MRQIIELWQSASDIPGANWVIGIAGMLILGWTAYYVVLLLRGMAVGDGVNSGDLLTEFQQLKEAGMLTDDEFERVRQNAPLPGVAQELLERERPEGLPSKSANQANGDDQPTPVSEPPARKLTEEELQAIRDRMAKRVASGEAILESEDTEKQPGAE